MKDLEPQHVSEMNSHLGLNYAFKVMENEKKENSHLFVLSKMEEFFEILPKIERK
jgi:hypothetical protein